MTFIGNNKENQRPNKTKHWLQFYILILFCYFSISLEATNLYVTNSSDNNVSVIDTKTNAVIGSITVGSFPTDIAITPKGTRAYVTNLSSNSVSVIDTITNTVIDTISMSAPFAIAINPDGTRAYATILSGGVEVIDLATNLFIGSPIPTGDVPNDIAITPDGSFAYVPNTNT